MFYFLYFRSNASNLAWNATLQCPSCFNFLKHFWGFDFMFCRLWFIILQITKSFRIFSPNCWNIALSYLKYLNECSIVFILYFIYSMHSIAYLFSCLHFSFTLFLIVNYLSSVWKFILFFMFSQGWYYQLWMCYPYVLGE